MSGIYAPSGEFINFAAKAHDLSLEFATLERMGLENFLGLMPDPDPVLLKRGDGFEILEELLSDEDVSIAVEKRILRTLNKTKFSWAPGHAEGEEPTPEAILICKQLEADFKNISQRDLFADILETPLFGLTACELMWQPTSTGWKLFDAVSKPRDWFAFDHDRQLCLKAATAYGDLVPKNKFLLTRHRPGFSNPYGRRLLSKCLWPVAFKKGGVKFWSRFVDKFGQPWVLAKGGKNSEERREMAGQLASMVQDAVAVLPPGTEAEITEASGKSGELHEKYTKFWCNVISKVITGQTLATDIDGQGSRAASETHANELDALAESDEAMLINAMNELAWTYTRLNADKKILAPVFSFVDPEDYQAKAELDSKLKNLGVKFNKIHFINNYNLSEEEFEVESGDTLVPDLGGPSDHAAPGSDWQDEIDGFKDELIKEGSKLSQKFTGRIKEAVEQAESIEDLQILLAELLGDQLGQTELEDLLSSAMLNAQFAGMAAMKEETGHAG